MGAKGIRGGILAYLCLGITVACGSAPKQHVSSVTDNAVDGGELESLYSSVTWIFQCPSSPIPVPVAGPNELVLVDQGPFNLIREKLVNVPVLIKGKMCPSERMKRDAIFVVDVSGSMEDSDPLVADPASPGQKTCGRYEAYKAFMANMAPSTSRFAVVTFGSSVIRTSSRLYDTQNELEAELTQNGTFRLIDDVLCEAPSGTAYVPALSRAKDLFSDPLYSRADATKELYFLSDGYPTDAADAELLSTELKTTGVTIFGQTKLVTLATVLLGGSVSTLMRDQMASLDPTGSPIFANVEDATNLAQVLDAMSSIRILGGSMTQGANGISTPQQTDVMPFVDPATNMFELSPTIFATDLEQTGYQAKLEYWNSQGTHFTTVGKINWID